MSIVGKYKYQILKDEIKLHTLEKFYKMRKKFER